MKEGRLARNLRTPGTIFLDNDHFIPIVIINFYVPTYLATISKYQAKYVVTKIF